MIDKETRDFLNSLTEDQQKVYEQGFIDGMQKQMRSSVDKAVNRMAQPEQEPVAWICEGSSSDEKHAIDYWTGDIDDLPIGTQLYTSPPPQRTWVGLTDEDKASFWTADQMTGEEWRRLFAEVEAKLKEKNT